mgnify:CR=1 FL=1
MKSNKHVIQRKPLTMWQRLSEKKTSDMTVKLNDRSRSLNDLTDEIRDRENHILDLKNKVKEYKDVIDFMQYKYKERELEFRYIVNVLTIITRMRQ